jgi:hypothetical protein
MKSFSEERINKRSNYQAQYSKEEKEHEVS